MRRVIEGAEPFFLPGGEVGCLLTHGFTASPQEVHELGLHLAQQGHTVLGVRMFAHGTRVEDMTRVRWTDWVASVEDGYHLLAGQCSKIVLIGLSVGGAVSMLLAADCNPSGVVALATPFSLPPDPRLQKLKPILKPLSLVIKAIPKGPPTWVDPGAQEKRVAYSAYPLHAILELEELLDAVRKALPRVRAPTFLMHSKNDRFIPPEHMQHIYQHLGSVEKSMAWVENSSHVITCDAERDIVFAAVADFVNRAIQKEGRT